MVDISADSHKLILHPERVAIWKEQKDCFPIEAEIGITNRCNHQCIFCALDWVKHGGYDIDANVLLSALKDMTALGLRSVVFAGEGEPLLHKNIGLFIEESKKLGLDVSMSTNGVGFGEERIKQILPNLSWIRFSVDAGTPETYAKIHRTKETDFQNVLKNIEECVNYKKKLGLKTVIGVQFLILPQNIGEALKLAEALKKIGADNLQLKPYSHHPKSLNDFSSVKEQYDKLEQDIKELNSENFKIIFRRGTIERIETGITYQECYAMPFFILIDAKGDILPCNLYYDSEDFSYGNLYTQSFFDIWKGEKRRKVIQKIKEKGLNECRRGCRLDSMNRYLHRLKNPELHDNFI